MKQKNNENFLEKIPVISEGLNFKTDENGIVTLQQVNKGLTNRIFQILFKKPKISYIHLDELGSFVWNLIDGEKKIMDFGDSVKEKFGDNAEPLYERLSQYFQILKNYGFIETK